MNIENNTFRVVEQFISINGEGRRAGQLALFVRFAGCNLNCAYCDTKWANEAEVSYCEYTIDELYQMIKDQFDTHIIIRHNVQLMAIGELDKGKLNNKYDFPQRLIPVMILIIPLSFLKINCFK